MEREVDGVGRRKKERMRYARRGKEGRKGEGLKSRKLVKR